jgi:nitrile hydratase
MSARFHPGEPVRVRTAFPHGHCRTPYYCRGQVGTVERICGEFRNAEALAYGRDGLPKQPLYRVRFPQQQLWPDYAGPPADTIDIEIYEHWLEPPA